MVTVEILDNKHGNVYEAYKEIGSPRSLSISETKWLKQKAWDTQKYIIKADAMGNAVIKSHLEPWSCMLIQEL